MGNAGNKARSFALLIALVVTALGPSACHSGKAEPPPPAQRAIQRWDTGAADELCEAVRTKDVPKVKAMLAAGADPNPTYSETCNPLDVAVAVRNIPLMEILLDAHADPNGVGIMGMSILYGAVFDEYEPAVELLLRRGARPDLTPTSPSILSRAASSPAIFRRLLEAGADPNRRDTYDHTPLMETARKDTELMRSLLDKGANPNIYDDRGWSALLNAVETQNIEAMNLLIGHGADVNHRDRDGWSAYDEARVLGCPAVVKILENAGAKD